MDYQANLILGAKHAGLQILRHLAQWQELAITDSYFRPERTYDPNRASSEPRLFNLMSLPTWLHFAGEAGVPHIAAELIAELEADAYLDAVDKLEGGDPAGKSLAALNAFEASVIAALEPGYCLRYEHAAPGDLKHSRGSGLPMETGVFRGNGDQPMIGIRSDLRIFETFMRTGEGKLRAYRRRIASPMMVTTAAGSWPVEWRVFIRDGIVHAVSNYYPQISLEGWPDWQRQVLDACRIATQLCEHVADRRKTPANIHMAPTGTWDLTVDVMTLDNGTATLLEVGPSSPQWAHPCCFQGRHIGNAFNGVALSSTGPALIYFDCEGMMRRISA